MAAIQFQNGKIFNTLQVYQVLPTEYNFYTCERLGATCDESVLCLCWTLVYSWKRSLPTVSSVIYHYTCCAYRKITSITELPENTPRNAFRCRLTETSIQMSMIAFCDLILEHLCAPQPGQRSKQTSRENMESLNASRNMALGRKNNLKLSPAEMSALNGDRHMNRSR